MSEARACDARGENLVLGTAQFGLDYGIANERGAPGDADAAAILALARSAGISALDTAIAYGDSESRLGRLGVAGLPVYSKLPAVPEGCVDISAWVRTQVDGSLARLRIDRLGALSLHRPAQLLSPFGASLAAALRAERAAGRVGAIGASIYAPEELPALFDAFDFDHVQAPYNVFDRRIVSSGWHLRLAAQACRLQLRSCFLQGLLLLPAARRPPWCRRWQVLFSRWDAWLEAQSLTPLAACLRFALAAPGRDKLVLGVDSPAQLEAILAIDGEPVAIPDELACDDPDLVNPSRWPTTKE